MVIVAQLVEPRIVIPVVVGSSPISHPSFQDGFQLENLHQQELLKMQSVTARVAELVDALDLGSSVLRRESSSLSFRTIFLVHSKNKRAFISEFVLYSFECDEISAFVIVFRLKR